MKRNLTEKIRPTTLSLNIFLFSGVCGQGLYLFPGGSILTLSIYGPASIIQLHLLISSDFFLK